MASLTDAHREEIRDVIDEELHYLSSNGGSLQKNLRQIVDNQLRLLRERLTNLSPIRPSPGRGHKKKQPGYSKFSSTLPPETLRRAREFARASEVPFSSVLDASLKLYLDLHEPVTR